MRGKAIATVAVLTLLFACDKPTEPTLTPGGTMAEDHVNSTKTVTVVPSSVTITVGGTADVKCEPRDAAGNLIVGRECKWQSLDPAIVTIGPDDFVVTQTLTGKQAGNGRVWAQSGGHRDTVVAVVGSTTSTCDRTVNVSTTTQLVSAKNNALPGDCIQMAAGTYALSSQFLWSRSGTEAKPIKVEGPAGSRNAAVIDANLNTIYLDGSYVQWKRFRITDLPSVGLGLRGSHDNLLDSMEIDNSNQELVQMSNGAHHNMVRRSYLHHSGRGTTDWEEGVYICDSQNLTVCRGNQVLFSTFECIGTEHIDLKGGADSTTIEGNNFDGRCQQGPDTLQTRHVVNNAVSIISVASKHNRIVYDTITYGSPHAIQLWKTGLGWSQNSQVDSNVIQLFNRTNHSAPRGINASADVTFKTCRDNVITDLTGGGAKYGGPASAACTPP